MLLVNSYASSSTPLDGSSQTKAPVPSGSTEVTKNMFLQLLVAQLRNQDPLNPSDGTQFMTQLAQFQSLEQSMNTGQDIAAILKDLNTLVPTTDGASTSKS